MSELHKALRCKEVVETICDALFDIVNRKTKMRAATLYLYHAAHDVIIFSSVCKVLREKILYAMQDNGRNTAFESLKWMAKNHYDPLTKTFSSKDRDGKTDLQRSSAFRCKNKEYFQ